MLDLNLNMDNDQPSIAPPAYPGVSGTDYRWKIRNARYQSTFTTTGAADIRDYREHLENLKDSFYNYSWQLGCVTTPVEQPELLDVQYSQAFGDIAQLICEYKATLHKIRPLQEEDILFLLLKRFAESTGAGVYLEIRNSGGIQVFDSDLAEPRNLASMEAELNHGTGVVNGEVPIRSDPHETGSNTLEIPYVSIPQTPPPSLVDSTVTINFPDMSLISSETGGRPSGHTPQLTYVEPPNTDVLAPVADWGRLPTKLQPPAFRVHRCHHVGIEPGRQNDEFELPFGFPEVIQHILETSEDLYHASFVVYDRSRQSLPISEGGMQAFECHIVSLEYRIYITVERQQDMLVYVCFRDAHIWEAAHENHEDCQGCGDDSDSEQITLE